jgi:hypothetical protein
VEYVAAQVAIAAAGVTATTVPAMSTPTVLTVTAPRIPRLNFPTMAAFPPSEHLLCRS